MSTDKKNDSENEQNEAEEPETAYRSESKIITISSLEELEELNRAHTGNLSPPQRMEYLRKLNENIFGFDLSRQKAEIGRAHV